MLISFTSVLGSIMTKSPKFNLCKWASPDNKDSSLEKENIEEDEQLKENISSQSDSSVSLYQLILIKGVFILAYIAGLWLNNNPM